MKLILEKHITYIAFNFNDVSYTVNAQTIDSATCNFFFELVGLVYIHFYKDMSTICSFLP